MIIIAWNDFGESSSVFDGDIFKKVLSNFITAAILKLAQVVKDLKEEFVRDYVFPSLCAGAVYERKYLLGAAIARLVIAKAMVDVAREVRADVVSHGCTGKGNVQVQFELSFFALNPKLNVVALWREWDITGKEDVIEYAKKHNVPIPVTKKSMYSRDRNLCHIKFWNCC